MAVTRPHDPEDRLRRLLEERGARPLVHPTTALDPPRDPGPLRYAAGRIASYDWIVVTSRNAVEPLRQALEAAGTARSMQGRVCAVGPGTARALEEAGLRADAVAARHVAEGVVELLRGRVRGLRVLYPRSEGARDVIPRGLEAAGARVDVVDAYRTVPDPRGAEALAAGVDRGEVDVITFAAGSAARSFAQAWRASGVGPKGPARAWPAGVGVVAIGPVTAAALEEEGLPVHATGEPHTLEGLVDAVEAWARESRA